MNKYTLCICGHLKEAHTTYPKHYTSYETYRTDYINKGEAICWTGWRFHKGTVIDRGCSCIEYRRDNLKYLEDKYE